MGIALIDGLRLPAQVWPLHLQLVIDTRQRDADGNPVVQIQVSDPELLMRLPAGVLFEASITPANVPG